MQRRSPWALRCTSTEIVREPPGRKREVPDQAQARFLRDAALPCFVVLFSSQVQAREEAGITHADERGKLKLSAC